MLRHPGTRYGAGAFVTMAAVIFGFNVDYSGFIRFEHALPSHVKSLSAQLSVQLCCH